MEISRAGVGVVDGAETYWSQSDFQERLFDAIGYSNVAMASLDVLERTCRRIRRASGDVSFERIYGWVPYYE